MIVDIGGTVGTVGALKIRMGFGGVYYALIKIGALREMVLQP